MEDIWENKPHGYARRFDLRRGQKRKPLHRFKVVSTPYSTRKDYGEPVVIEVVSTDRNAAYREVEQRIRDAHYSKYGSEYGHKLEVSEVS